MSNIEPCPFPSGLVDEYGPAGRVHYVHCNSCGACGPDATTRDAAIEAWNHVARVVGEHERNMAEIREALKELTEGEDPPIDHGIARLARLVGMRYPAGEVESTQITISEVIRLTTDAAGERQEEHDG